MLLVAAVIAAAAAATGQVRIPPQEVGSSQVGSSTKLGRALSRLDDQDRRFRVLVIGDSTSVDPAGWQQLMMQWLAEETGRPWKVHSWNAEPAPPAEPGYAPPERHRGGPDSAPLVMWNASAAGRNWVYTADHIADMAPAELRRIDLLLVNHGHNIRPAEQYADVGYPVIDRLRERFPRAGVVLFTQNPVRGDAPSNSAEARGFVHRYRDTRRVAVFGVYRAFIKSGRVEELVDEVNPRHPTPEGYRLWFELVRSRLASRL